MWRMWLNVRNENRLVICEGKTAVILSPAKDLIRIERVVVTIIVLALVILRC